MKSLKERIAGPAGKIWSILGFVAGFLVELAPYVDLLPKDSRLHYVAAGLVAFGLWFKGFPKKAPTPAVTPLVLLAAGALLFASPARGDGATFDGGATFSETQPSGILPVAGICSGQVCAQPVVTVVPIVVDFRSGNLSKDIGFGVGYGLTVPSKAVFGLVPGVDILGGVKTSGNWIAAVMPKLGTFRLGPVISHNPGVTYAGLGIGAGTP